MYFKRRQAPVVFFGASKDSDELSLPQKYSLTLNKTTNYERKLPARLVTSTSYEK